MLTLLEEILPHHLSLQDQVGQRPRVRRLNPPEDTKGIRDCRECVSSGYWPARNTADKTPIVNKKAMDPDVVAVSQVLSLKCPLSYMRLEVPCRGTQCSHIQSFDATSYLQLQEQGPQWVCPICNKPVPFEQLAVDE